MVNLWSWTSSFTSDVIRTVDDNVVRPLDAVSRDIETVVGDVKDKAADLVGLGKKPNAIPPGPARRDEEPRKVILGWHPVAGVGGKTFERLLMPLDVTSMSLRLSGTPNPTHHWAVLVGDYIHELNADASLDVVYQNYRFNSEELWYSKHVGTTHFNDEALRIAGEDAIKKMAGTYNIVTNNCQKFALAMLDLVLEGQRERFVTSYSPTAMSAAPEVRIRPLVKVFATEETASELMHAAKEKETAEAKVAGDIPGTVVCSLFSTMEEAEAAMTIDDSEKAEKAVEAAKLVAEAAKEAGDKVEHASIAEVTVVQDVVPEGDHVQQVGFAKQIMDEQTPSLST